MEIKIEDVYNEEQDLTFIIRTTYVDDNVESKEVLGCYPGQPIMDSEKNIGIFKAEYETPTNKTPLYYAIINIIDYLALYETVISHNHKAELYTMLHQLRAITGDRIEDIADANNAGNCRAFHEIVKEFREQYNRGERV